MNKGSSTEVAGYELTVTQPSGSFAQVELIADEWYHCKVTEIKKDESPNQKFGPQFVWIFELQGEDHQLEIQGNMVQAQVRGKTSMICSSQSRFFEWYSKILGASPEEGQKISTRDVIGRECYIMVKPTEGKDKNGKARTYYNVEKVKSGGTAAKPATKVSPAKPSVAKKPVPQMETTNVEDIEFDQETENEKPVTKAAVKPVAAKTTGAKKKEDVFNDVF